MYTNLLETNFDSRNSCRSVWFRLATIQWVCQDVSRAEVADWPAGRWSKKSQRFVGHVQRWRWGMDNISNSWKWNCAIFFMLMYYFSVAAFFITSNFAMFVDLGRTITKYGVGSWGFERCSDCWSWKSSCFRFSTTHNARSAWKIPSASSRIGDGKIPM